MKLKTLLLFASLTALSAQAQTDVTAQYIDNPDFAARFAGWDNSGMSFNTTTGSFAGSSGEVWMEKWVSRGQKVGSGYGIQQRIVGLEPGTYTLTVRAQNIQQGSDATVVQTGAYIFAADQQTEVYNANDYTVRFTLLTGETTIGFRTESATGNWVCVDNFRLTYEGNIASETQAEVDRMIAEAEALLAPDGNEAAALQQAIDAAKASATAETAAALSRATLSYRLANATGTAPKVTTGAFVATGTTIALGRSNVTGSGVVEKGFCWSTEPEPTLLDAHSTRFLSNNGNIYVMDKLQPGTLYYVRAYAIGSGGKVGYGATVKIATLPFGQVTCDYDYQGSEQENFRINSATLECIWLYNNFCNISGKNISVHYVPGVGDGSGTADCTINGWMRVSQNTAYQQTGTMLHETNHGVGVGTTDSWYNNPNLRTNVSTGTWLGPRATQMVRFFNNNNTDLLDGDKTHMWPYGINGAHEDAYNPENTCLYFANALITHALHQDGLVYQWWGTQPVPAYTFIQDDHQKYYLKSESADCGLGTSYLTMTSNGALRVREASADEARANDEFAWNITYDAPNSHYILYNVGSGKYLTYNGSTIKGVAKDQPTDAEHFQFMPGREEVVTGRYKGTAYWLMQGNKVLKSTATTTQVADWDPANTATNQRWLMLEDADMELFDAAANKEATATLTDLVANIRALYDTPHAALDGQTQEEVDEALLTPIEQAESALANGSSFTVMNAAVDDLYSAASQYLKSVNPTELWKPFDLSFYLINPDINKNLDGWTGGGNYTSSVCDFSNQKFDFNQTTTEKLPAGTYALHVSAFQRPGAYDATYTDFVTNGVNNVDVSIYAKAKTAPIQHIWAAPQESSLGGTTKKYNGLYIPNNGLAASKWFAAGFYDNAVMLTTTSSATMKVGIKGNNTGTDYWTAFDNFRLYFYGQYSIDDVVTPVKSITTEPSDDCYYDLQGRRVARPTRGLYIKNGKKILF
ncbi:MAG: hypothetical protein HUK02_04150 [Bacteroidaceae bacterium]|nr:hypothetical protein [Bacteroidaceae bacterium]